MLKSYQGNDVPITVFKCGECGSTHNRMWDAMNCCEYWVCAYCKTMWDTKIEADKCYDKCIKGELS